MSLDSISKNLKKEQFIHTRENVLNRNKINEEKYKTPMITLILLKNIMKPNYQHMINFIKYYMNQI